jgi:hypothetical protein
VLVHESHEEAKRVLQRDNAFESCMDASQRVLDEVDIYFEDQWHLTYHGKHRHRMEVLPKGFFLNKTQGQWDPIIPSSFFFNMTKGIPLLFQDVVMLER